VALQRRSTRSLTCQYRRHKPLFYIQPAREEVLNHKPRILLYHNAFFDSTIERIKELATPRVRTAEYVGGMCLDPLKSSEKLLAEKN